MTTQLDVATIRRSADVEIGTWHAVRVPFVVRWRAVWLVLFWATFGSTLFAIAQLSLVSRQQTFETGAARHVERLRGGVFQAQFDGPLPDGCLVGCDGLELIKASSADDAFDGAGRFWIDAPRGIVCWSPQRRVAKTSTTPIPVATLVVPGELKAGLGNQLLLFWIPAGILVVAGALLAAGTQPRWGDMASGQKRRIAPAYAAFALQTTAKGGSRIVAVLAVAVGMTFALVPDWNRLVTCPDSRSYVESSPIRTPLTAWWIAAFDSKPTEPRAGSLPAEGRTIAHWGPAQRYIWVVRAWKLLFVASVCVFTWSLSSIVPWWIVLSLILAAAAFDGSRGPWSIGMNGYLDALLSEPLSDSLVLLLLASLCAYFARPSWTRGTILVVCANFLLLARPASVVFASIIGCIWLFHAVRRDWSSAWRRAGGLATVLCGAIALDCTLTWARDGHFRQHAFTGMNLMTTALQVADPDDAAAFADPKVARYAQTAIGNAVAHRQNPFNAPAADSNCWKIAVPVYAATCGSPEENPYAADDVLTQVARTIIRRHPGDFARLAASNFWNGFWQTWIDAPLVLTGVAGIWLFRRSGDWRYLFVACLAGLPFVGILPGCITNYPIDRYRSLTSFAEIWSAPLLISVLLTRPITNDAKPRCGCADPSRSCA